MASRITVTGARHFQQLMFGRAVEALPTYYMALCSTPPTIFNIGEELHEPTIGSYARVPIPNDVLWWGENDAFSLTNLQDVIFAPATSSWGRLTSWALLSEPKSADCLIIGDFVNTLEVNTLDRVIIPAGAINIAISVLFQPNG